MADQRRPRRRRAARPRRKAQTCGLFLRLPLSLSLGLSFGASLLSLPLLAGAARAQDLVSPGGIDQLAVPGPDAPFGTGRLLQGTGPGPWIDSFDLFDLPAGGRAPAGAPRSGWTLTPSLAVQLGATDNVRNSRTDRQADVYARINPTIAVSADTEEVTGRLVYRPVARFNVNTSDQNRVDQIFSGQALVTLVPDLLYFDARGSGDVRSLVSDIGLTDEFGSRQDRVQGLRYQLSPYLVHRFGEFATTRIGYVYRGSSESGRNVSRPGETLPFFNGQGFTANEGYGILRSGENWGRAAWELRTVNTVFDGNGVYSGAYRYIHTLQVRYGLTREIAVLGEGGWQDQRFNGRTPFEVHDAVWSAGVRLSPDPDSVLIIRYGRRDGYNAVNGNGSINIGVRTRIFGAYSDRIGTAALQASDLLSSTVLDEFGNQVDSSSGIPAPLAYRTPFSTSQSNVFRIKRAIAGIGQTWRRDSVSLFYVNERRDPVAIAEGTTAFSTRTNSAGLSWTHSLTPSTTLSGLGRIGFTEQQAGRDGVNYTLQAVLSQRFTPTLFGSVLLRHTSRETTGTSGATTQNTILFSLRQFF
ncbi:TIGR03016 family PEP-CTERM system-associated outer membrane protein [Paracraurococcus ruber]|uniref:TIGR03016 family PEP-CTERM system-associated outer membrane protein n=1 Tax=Paracraurococcus ruber TaxID=77675 RepID=A0ABS1CU93_9PROT|nr:TIGR03016 family PEP-CTERM system-associated outer membrane protein [Paracraurococcus ruber]MBK1657572.1 TIGR03016 family PEP-CTERM system-associated outer membrane protein [Paracraurococcus ruber]